MTDPLDPDAPARASCDPRRGAATRAIRAARQAAAGATGPVLV